VSIIGIQGSEGAQTALGHRGELELELEFEGEGME